MIGKCNIGINGDILDATSMHTAFLQGVNFSSSGTGTFQIDGVVKSNALSRGHTVIILNRSDLSVVSATGYDTYGSTDYCGTIVSSISAQNNTKLIVMITTDAMSVTSAMSNVMVTMGGSSYTVTSARISQYFIGIPGLGSGKGYQAQASEGTTVNKTFNLLHTGNLGNQTYTGSYWIKDSNNKRVIMNGTLTYFGY